MRLRHRIPHRDADGRGSLGRDPRRIADARGWHGAVDDRLLDRHHRAQADRGTSRPAGGRTDAPGQEHARDGQRDRQPDVARCRVHVRGARHDRCADRIAGGRARPVAARRGRGCDDRGYRDRGDGAVRRWRRSPVLGRGAARSARAARDARLVDGAARAGDQRRQIWRAPRRGRACHDFMERRHR